MINIAILVPNIENCGPLNVVLNILKYIDTNKVKPYLISIKKYDPDSYFKSFEKLLGDSTITLDGNLSPDYLEKILKNYQIQCVHSHGYYPDKLLASVKLPGLKKISTIHCMFYKDYLKEYSFLKALIGAYTHFRFFNKIKFNYIVGCSESVSGYCKKHIYHSDVINTIHNGVDQSKFKILELNERKKIRNELVTVEGNIFIYAGRFIRRKRVPELIELFIKNRSKNDLLLLLGDGPEKEICECNYPQENIIFIGQVPDPEKYYQISDFVISNSTAEGYPMSIIEAVSCGCYALLSDIPSHREFIKGNPDSANFIFQLHDANVETLNFSKEAISKLSAKAMADKYLNLYLS